MDHETPLLKPVILTMVGNLEVTYSNCIDQEDRDETGSDFDVSVVSLYDSLYKKDFIVTNSIQTLLSSLVVLDD